MYLRRNYRIKDGKRHAYWTLVESRRTASGPRQRVVAHLGLAGAGERLGVRDAAETSSDGRQLQLFDDTRPEWVEVDTRRLRIENIRNFGGPWLGKVLLHILKLDAFFENHIPSGREDIPWPLMSQILVLGRFCEASSELRLAEDLYERFAFEELLGVPAAKVNDDRLYRALDQILTCKDALQIHLKEQMGRLFGITYDLLLYDVTSTYFEGSCAGNGLAQHGYSRDGRPDCKQVCIGLVVTREGLPLGYEVFAGNRHDSTTVEEIVHKMEARYGRAERIWVMDRGMVSAEKMEFLKSGGRKYIVGTPKSALKRFERDIVEGKWTEIRDGLEVQLCPAPDGLETYILCRSGARRQKEQAMHEKFEKRIEESLTRLAARLEKTGRADRGAVERQIGRMLGENTRAAGLFEIKVEEVERKGSKGLKVTWSKRQEWRNWARLSEGCYLLRSNVTGWSAEELWHAYIQLTEAEAAFRIHKSDLSLRPIWHQKADRVQAHILVCFLSYVLWKTLGQWCQRAGLGTEPRKVLDELQELKLVDVVLPTRRGTEIRKRCVSQPTEHQAILLERLRLPLPKQLKSIGAEKLLEEM
jgi:transposase